MTVTAIGDLHYEKLDHRIPNFSKLLDKTLHNTIDAALRRGTEAFVLVGDIFDNAYPSQRSQEMLLDTLTDYPDVPFYLPLGNHDFADAFTNALMLAKWTKKLKSNIIVVTEPKLIKVNGIRYQIMPHPYVQDMSVKADFAFAHFAVNGAKGDNGFTVRTKNQPKGNFVLGDFHTAQDGKVKQCVYDYVGSLTQLSWEESAKKSVITIEDGEKIRHRVDLAYKLAKYTVENDDELNACEFKKDTFYYLKTKNGYILPHGWQLDHPEVVRQSAVGVKKDKRASLLAADETFLHPLANLEPYLLSKKIDPSIVSRSVELAGKIKVNA